MAGSALLGDLIAAYKVFSGGLDLDHSFFFVQAPSEICGVQTEDFGLNVVL